MNKKNNRNQVLVILLVVAFVMMSYNLIFPQKPLSTYKYSEVVALFDNNKVTEYSLDMGTGTLKFKVQGDDKINYYTVPDPVFFFNQVQIDVDEYNKDKPDEKRIVYDWIRPQQLPSWISWAVTGVLFLGLLGLYWYAIKQSRGGGMNNFGHAKTRMADSSKKVTFDDVAGADEEKYELSELVEFLKNPSKFNSLGARIPKGVLLVGPPGTGKTLLARAASGEAGAPFYSISGSDFVEMFVGVGASRVRDLFDQAKKTSPSIIFIDEIDAVGRQRGTGLGGGHDEREQTLNQLLVEMDGFAANNGVIVMAATNRADVLDPALLRPGRFDRQIYVGYPDIAGREAILKVHARNKPLGPDVELRVIAASTVGFTGADLENLLNEAALLSARQGLKAITMENIEESTMKVMVGPEKKSKKISEKDKRLTAFHEAGHAVATHYMVLSDKVHQVSIIPRGSAGGYTLSLPSEDKSYHTRGEMLENLITLLGGRVAEHLVLDDISTGASNDIERATKIATAMVTRYGFSDKVGTVVYGTDPSEVFLGRSFSSDRHYSEGVASEIDQEIKAIIHNAFTNCMDILSAHMDQLQLVAEALLKYEKIEQVEFETIMNTGIIPERITKSTVAEGTPVSLEEVETLETDEATKDIEKADTTEE